MRSYTITEQLQSAAVATGTGTVMDISGMAVVAVQVTIAASATITFEAAIGSGTMTALPATNMATGAVATTATATGIYVLNVAGLTRFQARISTWGSGAVTAIAVASTEASASLAGALGAGSTTLTGPLSTQALAGSLATNETSATLYCGTATLSTSAAAIASSQAVREVLVQNDPDNTVDIFIGNSTTQSIQLKPGQSLTIPVADLATAYAKSASGTPTLNYLGRS